MYVCSSPFIRQKLFTITNDTDSDQSINIWFLDIKGTPAQHFSNYYVPAGQTLTPSTTLTPKDTTGLLLQTWIGDRRCSQSMRIGSTVRTSQFTCD